MNYALDLAAFGHYPAAEALLAAYAVKITKGFHKPEFRRVYHSRQVSAMQAEKISAYSEALEDTAFGAP